MKKIVVFLMVFSVGFSFAQDKVSPTIEKQGDLTLVTYYHDHTGPVTSIPRSAARKAAGYPPGPAPITTTLF